MRNPDSVRMRPGLFSFACARPRLWVCGAVCWVLLSLTVASPLHAQDPAQRAPAPAPAQEVAGVISEPDGRPVLGALVALEDARGQRLRSTLSDGDGRFRLSAPRSGEYLLRVERMGYRALVTEAFEVAAGEVLRRDVVVTGEPIPLAGVEVLVEAADRGCVLAPEEGAFVAELWDQAQQAFRRVETTEAEQGGYRFDLRRYERVVELPTVRVVAERWREPSRSLGSFESPPAEVLLAQGWVQRDADGNVVYYGPDLQVLLSPTFLQAHCLGVRYDPHRSDEVGIGFEPVRRARVPGIRGTLWLNLEGLELRRLEFEYTEHRFDRRIPDPLLELFGGEMEFRGLPDGRWVVDQWVLRVPRFRPVGRPLEWRRAEDPEVQARLAAIRRAVERAPRTWRQMVEEGRLLFQEEGGMLARVQTPGGAILPSRTEAALEGVAWDSLRVAGSGEERRPLEGAEVRLEGTDVRTTTDARGRFRLEVPLEGTYQATFSHPAMDSLRIDGPEPVTVHLRPGLVEEVTFALPSRTTLLARGCEGVEMDQDTGILVGTVLDHALRVPVGGALVTLRPEGRAEGEPAPAGWPATLQTRSHTDGSYRICGVPAGTWYTVAATMTDDEGPTRRIRVPGPGRIVAVDALVDRGERSRVVGRVREGERGPEVADVRITLEGPVSYAVRSDRGGRFRLEDLPPGGYTVRVEHLAYRNLERTLEIPIGATVVDLDITLLRDVIALEPMVVSVEVRSPRLSRVGYYDRQRSGFGSFLDREHIERRNPVSLTGLFTAIPRAQVVGERVLFRGAAEIFGALNPGTPSPCFPQLYVDGLLWGTDYGLGQIHPDEVEAIEVYSSAAQIPIQYNTADSACGVILVWLRDGSDPVR